MGRGSVVFLPGRWIVHSGENRFKPLSWLCPDAPSPLPSSLFSFARTPSRLRPYRLSHV